MKFGFQTFYHCHKSNSLDHLISVDLNTKQVKVHHSDKFAIQRFAIQISTVHCIFVDQIIAYVLLQYTNYLYNVLHRYLKSLVDILHIQFHNVH